MNSRIDNQEKDRPLHDAAHEGQTEVAKLFLDRGADIDATNKVSITTIKAHFRKLPMEVTKRLSASNDQKQCKCRYLCWRCVAFLW